MQRFKKLSSGYSLPLLFSIVFMFASTSVSYANTTPWGVACGGTSECAGNLACNTKNLMDGGLDKGLMDLFSGNGQICTCPQEGNGAYQVKAGKNPDGTTGERATCWGAGVPPSKVWNP